MKKLLVLFYLIFCATSAHSQEAINDSLRHNIETAANDSLRIEALYEYMKANLNNNTSDFEPYIKQMIFLSKKIKFKWGLSTAYILGLSYYKNKGDFELALQYADSVESVTKNDTAENMRLNMGHLHLNRGNLYYNIDDYEKAMDDYVEAAKIFKQIQAKFLASAYSGVANCFIALNNHPKALEYFQKGISVAKDFKDNRVQATGLMNLATEFVNINNYAQADSALSAAWPIVEKLQNSKSFHVYYYNKGNLEAYYKKDTLKALEYYRKSYDYALLNEDVSQQAAALREMIGFDLDLKHKDTKTNIDNFFKITKENYLKSYEADALDFYSQWYNSIGDYKKAYNYSRQYIIASDSIATDDAEEKISMMEVRFRVANKEQEINQLKAQQKIQQLSIRQKNLLNYILIGSAVLLLIIFTLAYRNYKHRQIVQQAKIDELETEKQLAATEAILKGEEQERTRLAKDLHDGLGGMLSGIKFSLNSMKGNLIMTPDNAQAFERSIDMLDNSIKEMRRVAHNMMPETLVNFGLDAALQEFCNAINETGALQINYQSLGLENVHIPQTVSVAVYRIVQELTSNILKHATARTAIIQLSKQENNLALTVEDDGKGFNTDELKKHKGIGLTGIRNRIAFLKGSFDIQTEPGKGTSVHIELNPDA